MLNFLKKKRVSHRTVSIPERWAEAREGVTTFGKNNFAYAEDIELFNVLSSIVIDAKL